MPKALSEIARDALNLPVAERRALARMLLDVSENDRDFSPEVDAAWEKEIMRRLAAVNAGTAASRPASDVFADLNRRFA
jgi:hypothetical protein